MLVGKGLLRDHNEDDAGAGAGYSEETSESSLDSDTVRVGPSGAAGPLSPFFTASRMTSSSSFARLLTTGGVDENACKSAVISAGGCSTNLKTKRFDNTYLEQPSILAWAFPGYGKCLPSTLVLLPRNAVPPDVDSAEDFTLDARRTVGAEGQFVPPAR